MIFATANSIYEVQQSEQRFRRLHEKSRWHRYQRMSPVTEGEPVRFYWLLGDAGSASRIGLWATGPVVAVADSGEKVPVGQGTASPPD